MVRTLLRSALREIRQSMGRYLAILAIVGLGVGFFAGLRACQPSMMATGVDYLDKQRLYDFRLLSSLGFTEEDTEAFAALEGVEAARGAVYADFLTDLGEGNEAVVRAHSLTEDMNLPALSAGRMPEEPYECLGDAKYFSEDMLGRTLTVAGDNSEDTRELLRCEGYTIVGLAWSPAYLNFERGTSSVGGGSVAAYVYIPEEGFDFEVYHEIYLTMTDAGEAYSDAYNARRDEMKPAVEDMVDQRAEKRYDDIYAEAMEAITDAQQEITDGWEDYHREKADAENELDDAYRELTDGESDYEQGQRDYEQGRVDYAQGQRDLADGQQKVSDARQELADAEQEVADGEKELADARQELDDGWAEYNQAKADADRELADARQKLEDGEREYRDGLAEYNEGEAKLADAEREIAAGEAELRDGQRQLDAAEAQLADAWYQLERGLRELEAAERQLRESESQYESLHTLYQTVESMGGIDAVRAAAEASPEAAALAGAWDQAESQLGSPLNAGTLSYLSTSITNGWAEYNSGLQEYQYGYSQYQDGAAQVEQSRRQLREAQAELDRGRKELADGQRELAEAKRQLDAAQKELDSGWAEYNDAKAQADRELADAYRKLQDGEAEYANGAGELAAGRQKLEDGRRELDDAQKELRDAQQKLADAKDQLDRAPDELADARHELDSGWLDYNDGRADAEREFADAERELTDAERELADAREKLRDLKHASTYVLTRSENTGYACFENDTSIVAAISVIFPAFFFLVAALVCMTTMTRMVDEQRTQIGVLKALGYSKGQIMSKYLFYAGSAALIGSLVGYTLGVAGLPWIIWEIYGMIYGFAPLRPAVLPDLASMSFAAALLCAMGSTYLACRMELKRQASELIRPKTPRAGRRVFLEYITPLWRRLSFLHKVSVRNVLRYRSRLVMMVLGIGGCTALLCTGFGIRDSIAHVADNQFDEITLYDYAVTFQDPQTQASAEDYLARYGWERENALLVHSGSVDVLAEGGVKSVYLVVSASDTLEGFLSLHNDEGPVAYPGPDQAVLNAGLAESLGLVPGDSIKLRSSELGVLEVTISALCDNYVFNYVYVSTETYVRQLEETPEYNTLYLKAHADADPYEEGAMLLEDEDVGAVTVNEDTRARVDSMLSRLDYIVVVIVLCAAALAFIVLYNLTNINITERIREIATIKVLGFYQGEVASYVFREINLLSVLGSLAGLAMGKGLHSFVMAQVKIDSMTFACRIAPLSYLISFAMTLLFTVVISTGMRPRLRKIDMAESLKSIE